MFILDFISSSIPSKSVKKFDDFFKDLVEIADTDKDGELSLVELDKLQANQNKLRKLNKEEKELLNYVIENYEDIDTDESNSLKRGELIQGLIEKDGPDLEDGKIDELIEDFLGADTNKNGRVSESELRKHNPSLTNEEVHQLFKAIRENHDGGIKLADWIEYFAGSEFDKADRNDSGGISKREFRKFEFKEIDTNGDRKISKEEWIEYYGNSDDFDKADRNHNGTISKREFKKYEKEQFKNIDTDHNRKISEEEWNAYEDQLKQSRIIKDVNDFVGALSTGKFEETNRALDNLGFLLTGKTDMDQVSKAHLVEHVIEKYFDDFQITKDEAKWLINHYSTEDHSNLKFPDIDPPVVDPVVDPVTDPVVIDPVVDPVTDPVIDPVTDPVIDPVTDPVVVDPVVDPVTDPVVIDPVVIDPVVDPVTDPVVVDPPPPPPPPDPFEVRVSAVKDYANAYFAAATAGDTTAADEALSRLVLALTGKTIGELSPRERAFIEAHITAHVGELGFNNGMRDNPSITLDEARRLVNHFDHNVHTPPPPPTDQQILEEHGIGLRYVLQVQDTVNQLLCALINGDTQTAHDTFGLLISQMEWLTGRPVDRADLIAGINARGQDGYFSIDDTKALIADPLKKGDSRFAIAAAR